MTFGAKNDTIMIADVAAVGTSPAIAKIDGGAGVNTLDLSAIKLAPNTAPSFSSANGTTTIKFKTIDSSNKAVEHTIELKNFQSINIGGKNYNLKTDETFNVTAASGLIQNITSGNIYKWSPTSSGTNELPTIINGQPIGDNSYNVLELPGNINDYVFTTTGVPKDGQYFVAHKSDPSKKVQIMNIQALKFSGNQVYMIRGIGGGLMQDDLSLKGLPVLAFGTESNTGRTAEYMLDDYFTGSVGNNNLTGFYGNDTFVQSSGNDTLDGGEGVDTFIASGPRGKYNITQGANGEIIVLEKGTQNKTVLKNFESIIFTNNNLPSSPISLQNFTFDTDQPKATATYLWDGLSDATYTASGTRDIVSLPTGVGLSNFSYNNTNASFEVQYLGNTLTLKDVSIVEIGGKNYLLADLVQNGVKATPIGINTQTSWDVGQQRWNTTGIREFFHAIPVGSNNGSYYLITANPGDIVELSPALGHGATNNIESYTLVPQTFNNGTGYEIYINNEATGLGVTGNATYLVGGKLYKVDTSKTPAVLTLAPNVS